MAVNFFEREVIKIQKRFNETFGRQTVCNLDVRYSAILSICWLGVLGRRIKKAEEKEKVRDSIHEFVRIRDVLNDFFNLMEREKKGGDMPKKSSEKEEEFIARAEFERLKKKEAEKQQNLAEEEKKRLKELHFMRCPKCGMELIEIDYKGIKVDKCSGCIIMI